jgi:N-glycosylase/DNA lyase
MNSVSAERIREAVASIVVDINDRVSGRTRTTAYDERELWAELTCCVLSSQVPYKMAKAAAERIDGSGVLCKSNPVTQPILERELLELLSTPVLVEDSYRRYRFPKSRAAQIASAYCVISEEWGSLAHLLGTYTDVRFARSWLVANLPGVGPKQASMFLRNATGAYDLAVLDRHVLNYMRVIELCEVTTSDVATIKRYELCETQLRRHADSLGHEVGMLDWAIWIVMRVASGINARWES